MKILKSFGYAITGLKLGMKERNMRLHLFAALIVIFFGIALEITALEWVVILLCIGLVIATELLNTAIEKLTDVMTKAKPELYEHAGKPKDIGAGAVLVAACIAFSVGIFIFMPKIILLIQ